MTFRVLLCLLFFFHSQIKAEEDKGALIVLTGTVLWQMDGQDGCVIQKKTILEPLKVTDAGEHYNLLLDEQDEKTCHQREGYISKKDTYWDTWENINYASYGVAHEFAPNAYASYPLSGEILDDELPTYPSYPTFPDGSYRPIEYKFNLTLLYKLRDNLLDLPPMKLTYDKELKKCRITVWGGRARAYLNYCKVDEDSNIVLTKDFIVAIVKDHVRHYKKDTIIKRILAGQDLYTFHTTGLGKGTVRIGHDDTLTIGLIPQANFAFRLNWALDIYYDGFVYDELRYILRPSYDRYYSSYSHRNLLVGDLSHIYVSRDFKTCYFERVYIPNPGGYDEKRTHDLYRCMISPDRRELFFSSKVISKMMLKEGENIPEKILNFIPEKGIIGGFKLDSFYGYQYSDREKNHILTLSGIHWPKRFDIPRYFFSQIDPAHMND